MKTSTRWFAGLFWLLCFGALLWLTRDGDDVGGNPAQRSVEWVNRPAVKDGFSWHGWPDPYNLVATLTESQAKAFETFRREMTPEEVEAFFAGNGPWQTTFADKEFILRWPRGMNVAQRRKHFNAWCNALYKFRLLKYGDENLEHPPTQR